MTWVILDTSYLMELYRVPGNYEEDAHTIVVDKLTSHISTGGRLYVPVPVIFELANHIADVSNGSMRRNLAHKLHAAVSTSLADKSPWVVIPMTAEKIVDELTAVLIELCDTFAKEYAAQGIGLTDAAIIDLARRLAKSKAGQQPRPLIHIWTRDKALKAHEPDAEINYFV